VHYDLTRGTSDIWSVPDGDCVCEPAFVQRSPESDEGDGWLITLVYRAATHTSEVAILDTRDITAGPIATAKMDSRVPNGFHGSWVAA
jgi:carotenoid cleavage dioxygenase